MSELISARLRRRARTAGAEPLLTWYDPSSAARVELSAVTLLNWVDKTSHLLDELDVAEGEQVWLALADEAPGHWVTSVWELACWQVGATVVAGSDGHEARLLVSGPRWAEHVSAGLDQVACSLHPLGLPLSERLPPAVLDYALEVRGQADAYPAVPGTGSAPAWRDAGRLVSQADLVAEPWPPTARRLVRPSTAWETAHAAVVAPLLSGGSTVVVEGPVTDAELARITADERCTAEPG